MGSIQLQQDTINQAVAMTAEGHSYRYSGKKLGIAHSTVQKIAKRHKAAVQALAIAIAAKSTKLCLDNHVKTLQLANNILSAPTDPTIDKVSILADMAIMGLKTKDILTLADRKENRALQIMGIAPTHTQSTVIQNIFNQESLIINNRTVLAVLGREKARQLEHVAMPELGLEGHKDAIDV